MAKSNNKKGLPLRLYKEITQIMSKAYTASNKVLEENKRLGIPTPFSLNGRIYYLLPDGRIILKRTRKRAC